MRVLFLGYTDSPLIHYLETESKDIVFVCNEKVDLSQIKKYKPHFIVSYGYRHILPLEIVTAYPNQIINLHISYLPWNRGADPAFWSILEGTTMGVTIHYIDRGIDTGDIIAQKQVNDDKSETLLEHIKLLHGSIQELFKKEWPKIKAGAVQRAKQQGAGSTHKVIDKEPFLRLLPLKVVKQLGGNHVS